MSKIDENAHDKEGYSSDTAARKMHMDAKAPEGSEASDAGKRRAFAILSEAGTSRASIYVPSNIFVGQHREDWRALRVGAAVSVKAVYTPARKNKWRAVTLLAVGKDAEGVVSALEQSVAREEREQKASLAREQMEIAREKQEQLGSFVGALLSGTVPAGQGSGEGLTGKAMEGEEGEGVKAKAQVGADGAGVKGRAEKGADGVGQKAKAQKGAGRGGVKGKAREGAERGSVHAAAQGGAEGGDAGVCTAKDIKRALGETATSWQAACSKEFARKAPSFTLMKQPLLPRKRAASRARRAVSGGADVVETEEMIEARVVHDRHVGGGARARVRVFERACVFNMCARACLPACLSACLRNCVPARRKNRRENILIIVYDVCVWWWWWCVCVYVHAYIYVIQNIRGVRTAASCQTLLCFACQRGDREVGGWRLAGSRKRKRKGEAVTDARHRDVGCGSGTHRAVI